MQVWQLWWLADILSMELWQAIVVVQFSATLSMSSSRSGTMPMYIFYVLYPSLGCQTEGMVFSIDWTPSSTLTQVQFLRSRNNDKIVGILGPTNIQQSKCGTIQLTWKLQKVWAQWPSRRIFHVNPCSGVLPVVRGKSPTLPQAARAQCFHMTSISPYILIFLTILWLIVDQSTTAATQEKNGFGEYLFHLTNNGSQL